MAVNTGPTTGNDAPRRVSGPCWAVAPVSYTPRIAP